MTSPGEPDIFSGRRFTGGCSGRLDEGSSTGEAWSCGTPAKISLGDRVSLDDNVMLDASGAGEQGITLGDGVIVSRNCVLQGKTGPVLIGNRTDIGCDCVFSSICGIEIGESTLIAAHCYIGGGQYHSDRLGHSHDGPGELFDGACHPPEKMSGSGRG